MKRVSKKDIQFIMDGKGKKRSVIQPVETYEEMLEDIQDLVAVVERRKDKSISLAEMEKRLKQDDIV